MNPELLLAHFDRISDAPDAVPRLRRFILDLGVRGKLVEQNANDEPVSKLMSTIEAQKSRLGLAGVMEIVSTDEGPFDLPSNWLWVRLGDLCSKTGSGSTPRGGKSVYQRKGVPFLRSQNVYNDGLRLDEVAYISHQTHEKMSGTSVKPRDLLLNITGGSIGRCCIVSDGLGEANVSQHVAIIRLAVDGIQRYLHRLILSPYFQSYVISEQTGAGRGGLPKNRMDRILVALPSLSEQHRIVARVDELMGVCDRLEASRTAREHQRDRLTAASLHHFNNGLNAEASRKHTHFCLGHFRHLTTCPHQIKQLRQTILNLAVRGQLVPQDPSDESTQEFLKRISASWSENEPFPIPSSWSWISVGQIGESRLGKMLDKAKNKGTLRRYLRNVNVRWFDFDLLDVFEMRFEDDEIEEFSLRRGDVLICEGGEPGRAAVWDEREEKIYFQKAIHRVRFPEGVDPYFFVNALRESADSGRLSEYFTGVGIKHFTGKGLSSFLFPLAPLAEQGRILAKVNELMSLCDSLETQLTNARDESHHLLEAVLQHALIDDSPRSELAQQALPT
jgi:type I restriction enzyme, S subunit